MEPEEWGALDPTSLFISYIFFASTVVNDDHRYFEPPSMENSNFHGITLRLLSTEALYILSMFSLVALQNIQSQPSDASVMLPQHNYKLDVHALNSHQPGQVNNVFSNLNSE
jgi:hypothetical protein